MNLLKDEENYICHLNLALQEKHTKILNVLFDLVLHRVQYQDGLPGHGGGPSSLQWH